jgi:glycosyltransferase involved in cell wall biosynthesis
MRICFLGDAGSIHIQRWCEFFRDNGDEVYLLSFRKGTIDGVNVINLGEDMEVDSSGGNFQYLKKISHIKRLVREIKPDILNAHYLTSYGLIGALINYRPFVVSTWGSDILVTPYRNLAYRMLTNYVIKKCNLLTSDSEFMSNKIIELGGEKNKVITAPMGIDSKIFNSNEKKPLERVISFLSMRTLIKNSNVDIIISAFYKLSQEVKNIELTIVNDGDTRKELEATVNELSLNDRIQILGAVSRDKVVSLLKEKDVYISIPTSDSTSVTLLEAMACGIFPIVSDLPANKEWIRDSYNGYILKDVSVDELYETMKRSLCNLSLVNKSIAINDRIINERAIWEDNMTKVRDMYCNIST